MHLLRHLSLCVVECFIESLKRQFLVTTLSRCGSLIPATRYDSSGGFFYGYWVEQHQNGRYEYEEMLNVLSIAPSASLRITSRTSLLLAPTLIFSFISWVPKIAGDASCAPGGNFLKASPKKGYEVFRWKLSSSRLPRLLDWKRDPCCGLLDFYHVYHVNFHGHVHTTLQVQTDVQFQPYIPCKWIWPNRGNCRRVGSQPNLNTLL